MSFASRGIVGPQVGDEAAQLVGWRPAARSWRMNGVAASSVAGVERTPGSASRANARSGGKDALRLANAGVAGVEHAGQLGDRLLAARRPRRRRSR